MWLRSNQYGVESEKRCHNKTEQDTNLTRKMLKSLSQIDGNQQQPQLQLLWEDKEVKFDVPQL